MVDKDGLVSYRDSTDGYKLKWHTAGKSAEILANLKTPDEILQAAREQMEVTPFMFKQALTRSGNKRAQVEALVTNPNTGHQELDQDIKDGWADAKAIKRLDAIALYVKWALGWSDEESDVLFELAETFRDG